MELNELEKSIGYEFKNKDLLKTALTHTSYAYENNVESNEKLEFLGDSILEFLSSKYLFNNYKDLKEGEMTKVRATVVCEESLKIRRRKKVIKRLIIIFSLLTRFIRIRSFNNISPIIIRPFHKT